MKDPHHSMPHMVLLLAIKCVSRMHIVVVLDLFLRAESKSSSIQSRGRGLVGLWRCELAVLDRWVPCASHISLPTFLFLML